MANQTEGSGTQSQQQQNSRYQRFFNLLSRYSPPADVSSALATILLVVVGVWGVEETKHALETSERAWIGIGGVQGTQNPVKGDPFHYQINYIDSGKEPATHVAFAQTASPIDVPMNDDFSLITLPPNTTCDSLAPANGSVAVPNVATGRGMDTGRGDRPLFISDEMMHGNKYIVIQGCIAYTTVGKPHHSAWCAIVEIKPTPAAVTITPATSTATPTQVPTVGVGSFLCATGFSAD